MTERRESQAIRNESDQRRQIERFAEFVTALSTEVRPVFEVLRTASAVEPEMAASVFASSLAATLEMVREGLVDMHQHAAFAPIYLRKRAPAIDATGESGSAAAADATKSQS